MTVESATYISDLTATNPASGDPKSEGDDHIRLVKSTVKATFPNVSGAVTPTHTELNYVDGVTSAIQTQLTAGATFLQSGTAAVSRTMAAKVKESVSLMDFGAVGDGIADDTAAIEDWIVELMASGRKGFAPAGTYYMASALTITVTGNVDVEASDNAVFVGGAAINSMMILFLASTRDTYQVSWSGGAFDVSATIYVLSSLSGGGLGLQKVWKCVVDGVRFIGPADYSTGGGFGGDTGLAIVDSRFVTVSNCVFSGLRDLGIYITGDSNTALGTGDGGDIVVSGNHFIKCAGGVGIKRQTQRVNVSNNTFNYCYRGVLAVSINTGTINTGGSRTVISNNSFAYTAKDAVLVSYSSSLLISHNRIQDFGYALDGTTPVSNPTGLLLEGTTNALVNGNWIGLEDWAVGGSHSGVLMQDYTYDSVLYDSEYNTVSNNYFLTLDVGCRETTSESDYNQYLCNTFRTVTATYSNLQANSITFDYNTATPLTIGKIAVTSPSALDGNVFSGTYTPTLTNGANVASSSASVCQYMRVGIVVTVSGTISVTPTATGTRTLINVSLPVTSALSSTIQLAGTATFASATVAQNTFAMIIGDSTNDNALFSFSPNTTSANSLYFTFTYRVI